MLEMKTKWFSNSLAKQMMSKNDFILTSDAKRLYVVGFGTLTSSAKNTYNIELRNENENVLYSQDNLYLDAITKLILGTSPKSKSNKEATKEAKATTKKANKESLLLTFNEAFEIACKDMESYKKVAKLLGKYSEQDAINITLHLIKEAKESEAQRIKDAKKKTNIEALQRTLEIAIESQNNAMIEQIKQMIIIEESL